MTKCSRISPPAHLVKSQKGIREEIKLLPLSPSSSSHLHTHGTVPGMLEYWESFVDRFEGNNHSDIIYKPKGFSGRRFV